VTSPEESPRFVFDQHIRGPAFRQLRARGVDVARVAELNLAERNGDPAFTRCPE
jgi:hypothetical protein